MRDLFGGWTMMRKLLLAMGFAVVSASTTAAQSSDDRYVDRVCYMRGSYTPAPSQWVARQPNRGDYECGTRTQTFSDRAFPRNPDAHPADGSYAQSQSSNALPPGSWVGRRPTDMINGRSLFEHKDIDFGNLINYANSSDPARRPASRIRWGTAVEAGSIELGGETVTAYAAPFCFVGDCANPDAEAANLYVFLRTQFGSVVPSYAFVTAPWGTRMCRVASVRYVNPVCYDAQTMRLTYRPDNLRMQALSLLPFYKAFGDEYERNNPAQPGSIQWMADHIVCEPVVVEHRRNGRAVDYSSSSVCHYRP